jgi:hypothetical protein
LSYTPIQRQHNNTHPTTKEPLTPSDLITLHYSRKPSGEIHDPISFKPFSEHSHIVAIATTGNVFTAESIKGGKDLLEDVKFKKLVDGFLLCYSGLTVLLQGGRYHIAKPPWSPTLVYCYSCRKEGAGQAKTSYS